MNLEVSLEQVEIQSLEELGFSHEPGKWANSAFTLNVHPLPVSLNLGNKATSRFFNSRSPPSSSINPARTEKQHLRRVVRGLEEKETRSLKERIKCRFKDLDGKPPVLMKMVEAIFRENQRMFGFRDLQRKSKVSSECYCPP